MKNANKAVRELEQKVTPAESVSPSSGCIIDGKSLIQKMHGDNCTIVELHGHVFARVVKAGGKN